MELGREDGAAFGMAVNKTHVLIRTGYEMNALNNSMGLFSQNKLKFESKSFSVY